MTKPTVVVLAEDEWLLRLYQADLLAEEGYSVLQAATAEEAAEILRVRAEVQVLVTDVEMPGELDGFGLVRLARIIRPTVGVVITSGRASPRGSDLQGEAVFLAKPFTPAQFLEAVRLVTPRAGPGLVEGSVSTTSGSRAVPEMTRLPADPGPGGEMAQFVAKPSQD